MQNTVLHNYAAVYLCNWTKSIFDWINILCRANYLQMDGTRYGIFCSARSGFTVGGWSFYFLHMN